MIEIVKLTKSYGRHAVLKGIDLTIRKGDVVAVLGPSGSGKTTLLRCLNHLEKPDGGRVAIGDFAVDCRHARKKEIHQLRQKTAMVFQQYNLFQHKTAIENVMEGLIVVKKLPKAEAKQIALAHLRKVGLADKQDAYPSQLSGGQQQRVGIARALAMNPDVMLLDEPTSALDPELVGEVLEVIRKISREGITMIIVTHEMAFAQDVASHVVFMDQGVIIEQGTAGEMFGNPQEERTRQFFNRFRQAGHYSI